MRGGRPARRKGNRVEREIVRMLQDAGLAAERMPLSGSAGGSFAGDLSVPVLGVDRRIEAKARATGFRQLYAWLAGHYGLVLKADRQEPLICLRLTDFARLARKADERRSA
jgi:hypothetical protein